MKRGAAAFLWIALMLVAAPAAAEPWQVGQRIEPIALPDQHGAERKLDATARGVLFTRDMKGGDLIEAALEQDGAELLADRGTAYVADVSGMPGLIWRLFAGPSLRRRPYSILVDRSGEATASIPSAPEAASLITLDHLVVRQIRHFQTADDLRKALAPKSEPPPEAEPESP